MKLLRWRRAALWSATPGGAHTEQSPSKKKKKERRKRKKKQKKSQFSEGRNRVIVLQLDCSCISTWGQTHNLQSCSISKHKIAGHMREAVTNSAWLSPPSINLCCYWLIERERPCAHLKPYLFISFSPPDGGLQSSPIHILVVVRSNRMPDGVFLFTNTNNTFRDQGIRCDFIQF